MRSIFLSKNSAPLISRANVNLLLSGADVGIPLNLFSDIYTQAHYGYNILTSQTILLQFLFGYYAYGIDRYKDAIEYYQKPYPCDKIDLYTRIYKYKDFYKLSLIFANLGIIYILFNDEMYINLTFLPLLITAQYYKEIKPYLSIYKPFYISFMWTTASIIIPAVLYENNFSILNYPQDYLPCFFLILATSNFADNKDINEDKLNNIETFPIKFGIINSNLFNFVLIAVSSLMFLESSHYFDRPFINTFLECQNFGFMYLIYNNTYGSERIL